MDSQDHTIQPSAPTLDEALVRLTKASIAAGQAVSSFAERVDVSRSYQTTAGMLAEYRPGDENYPPPRWNARRSRQVRGKRTRNRARVEARMRKAKP